MQIKMIRDKGNLKKGNIYNFDDTKANKLLTDGYCIRAKITEKKVDKPKFEKKKFNNG